MALRDITGSTVPLTSSSSLYPSSPSSPPSSTSSSAYAHEYERWRPAYNASLRRFINGEQEHSESLLDHYCRRNVCFVPLSRKEAECVEFRDSKVMGIRGIRRDMVIVLACRTAVIMVCVPSRYGHDDYAMSREAHDEAVEEAHGYVKRLEELIQECREMGGDHFEDPSSIGCVVFAEWDIHNRGRVESFVQRIMEEGMTRLGITSFEKLQHMETDGDMDARPGLGSIVVLSPAIAGSFMPHIIIDDEVEWGMKPANIQLTPSADDVDEN
ncbi:hypothetical protein Sste5346_007312 [Sporothrix stenoceras]|uniref:Uncharacterized protein n=1 Tax=Sporothrix stenoceras TaxID=5173 RepID=A0ABR3YUA1_9PEZI